jgi:hypothetical protein
VDLEYSLVSEICLGGGLRACKNMNTEAEELQLPRGISGQQLAKV